MSRTSRGGWLLALSVLLLVGLPVLPAHAEPGEDCFPACPTGAGGEGTFTITDSRPATGSSQAVPGRPAVNGRLADEVEWDVVEEDMVPACSNNSRGGADTLCLAAVVSCPAQDQVRFWIWHRTTHYVDGVIESVSDWKRLPDSYCLGPDDPGLDQAPTLADVVAETRALFLSENVPLPVFALETNPAPQTLVNVPTVFSAGSAEAVQLPPVVIFGRTIRITATPRQWRWFFGDNTALNTATPGRPRQPDVTHEYLRAGRYTSRVRVTWSGAFTVNGGEPIGIADPAFRTSSPQIVDVREARTELVRD